MAILQPSDDDDFIGTAGISGSLTFHKSKLHVINLNLLPDSVLKNPFYDFHSMFQRF